MDGGGAMKLIGGHMKLRLLTGFGPTGTNGDTPQHCTA